VATPRPRTESEFGLRWGEGGLGVCIGWGEGGCQAFDREGRAAFGLVVDDDEGRSAGTRGPDDEVGDLGAGGGVVVDDGVEGFVAAFGAGVGLIGFEQPAEAEGLGGEIGSGVGEQGGLSCNGGHRGVGHEAVQGAGVAECLGVLGGVVFDDLGVAQFGGDEGAFGEAIEEVGQTVEEVGDGAKGGAGTELEWGELEDDRTGGGLQADDGGADHLIDGKVGIEEERIGLTSGDGRGVAVGAARVVGLGAGECLVCLDDKLEMTGDLGSEALVLGFGEGAVEGAVEADGFEEWVCRVWGEAGSGEIGGGMACLVDDASPSGEGPGTGAEVDEGREGCGGVDDVGWAARGGNFGGRCGVFKKPVLMGMEGLAGDTGEGRGGGRRCGEAAIPTLILAPAHGHGADDKPDDADAEQDADGYEHLREGEAPPHSALDGFDGPFEGADAADGFHERGHEEDGDGAATDHGEDEHDGAAVALGGSFGA